MKWHEKLSILRDRCEFSLTEVGLAAGVKKKDASTRAGRWEKGEGEPSMTQALGMARKLGVSLDYFADDTLDRDPIDLTPEEDLLLQTVRRLKGGVAEAMARIANATEPPGDEKSPRWRAGASRRLPDPNWGAAPASAEGVARHDDKPVND